jgi:hypothetical protein
MIEGPRAESRGPRERKQPWLRALVLVCALSPLPSALSPVLAQDDPYRPLAKLPTGSQLLTLPSSHIPSQGLWEVKFTHRFNQSLSNGSFADQVHSLFGLDTNADVMFGFSYALRRDLELSIARTNTNDTIEAAAKYIVLQQAAAVPLTLAVRGGADWRTERGLGDRNTLFAQAIISRRFGTRTEIFALPTFATNAGRAVSGDGSAAMFDTAFNVAIGIIYMVRPPLGVVAELIPPNSDLPDQLDSGLGWAIGIKRAIGGHWFEILLTNTQGTTVDQYVSSTFQGGSLDEGEVKLGFNIERRFGRRR